MNPGEGLERLSLNTATTKNWTLEQAVAGCVEAGIPGIGPWRDRVEEIGVDKAARLIRNAGLTVTSLCRGGFLTARAPEARRAALADNRLAIDEAATLGCSVLVLVVGGLPEGSRDLRGARRAVQDGIAELAPYAAERGVTLAIEPLHPMYAADRACVNTTSQALDLCDRLDPGRTGLLGVALDVYHVWWDPEIMHQIRRAGRDRLLAFHICDWLVPTTDMLNDRGMMGDGVIDIPSLRAAVEEAGFDGYAETEIFSERWWSLPMEDVLRTCIGRYRTCV
jgi:sugar phosphate isomerase/epimerase